jgi:STE24 endopeptidase
MRPRRWLSIVLLISATFSSVSAQTSSAPSTTPVQNSSGPAFDVKAAVDAYLATVPADQRARSDAYFEGGYWLLLWDFVSTVIAMWLLLQLRISARMRSWAERLTHFRVLQTTIYWIEFIVLVTVVTFRSRAMRALSGNINTGYQTRHSAHGCGIR